MSISESNQKQRTPSINSDDKEKEAFGSSNVQEDIPPLATREFIDSDNTLCDALLKTLRLRRRSALDSLDEVATQPSVYDGPLASNYAPCSEWENLKNFDPMFRWTWREEKIAVRKVDFKIFFWVLVMFLALDIDRDNIATATADNFLKDLHLTQADYNLGNTLSKLGFLIAELPSQLVSKRLGPDRWIPIQLVIFSIISTSQFWLSGRSSFLAARFLIAFFQGGFIPDVILYLSYYYTKKDLPIRLAFFWSINYIADLIMSFIGVGLNKMRGVVGYAGWRWVFLIEGIFTLLIGIASFWMMPKSPSETKTNFRPNGYLTDREAKIIVNRSIRDDPGKGGMHNRQHLTLRMIWKSLTDWDLIPVYLIGILWGIPCFPVKQYLQLSLRELGFSTVNANLLTVPNTILSVFMLLAVTALSEVVDNRAFVASLQCVWQLPNYIALDSLKTISPWQYFAIATILLGYPYTHAIHVAWLSRNSGTVRTRTVSASIYNMSVQTSAIIGSNLYQASDAPRYHKANRGLIGLLVFNIGLLYPGTWLYYTWRNKQKSTIWDSWTDKQKNDYLATTKDEGNKRLDFQFAK